MSALDWIRLSLALLLGSVSGCAQLPRTDALAHFQQQVSNEQASNADAVISPLDVHEQAAVDARVTALLALPLTPQAAVEVTLLRNPEVLEAYAQLGLSEADVAAAGRIANPIFAGSLITGAGERQAIGSIEQSLSDLVLLATRKRLAAGEYQRIEDLQVAKVLDLIRDTDAAWYRYVGAEQIKSLRAAVAHSAELAATLAQRFFDAGNVSALELAVARANAAQARLAAVRAATDARAAQYHLQTQMGLTGPPRWSTPAELPAPSAVADPTEALVARALERRPDLRAAREEVTFWTDALRIARRWRWLGAVDVGVEREREPDGHVLNGPTLTLALPIFNQGQVGIARAQSQLELRRARVRALETAADNSVRLGCERVLDAYRVAEEYRTAVVPEYELMVQRQQELQNYMLIGQFELLRSKQQQYDAYQGYLEAVRDFWLARVELGRAVGMQLAPVAANPTIGTDAILETP